MRNWVGSALGPMAGRSLAPPRLRPRSQLLERQEHVETPCPPARFKPGEHRHVWRSRHVFAHEIDGRLVQCRPYPGALEGFACGCGAIRIVHVSSTR